MHNFFLIFNFHLHIYTFKAKKYNHQIREYECTWNPREKGLEQRMIIGNSPIRKRKLNEKRKKMIKGK